ncbi:MAG: hypothetical protein AAFY38_06015 [Pseudomonadota bacterium]
MTGPQKTLLAIALFIALALGGFIWFVSNWQTGQVNTSSAAAPFSWPQICRGPGQSPGPDGAA